MDLNELRVLVGQFQWPVLKLLSQIVNRIGFRTVNF